MKIVRWLDDHLEELCLTLLLIGISAIMVTQVIARYVFNYSLSWSDELARYCLVWSAFLSVSFCVKKRISIKIDQVQNALPERGTLPTRKKKVEALCFTSSFTISSLSRISADEDENPTFTSPDWLSKDSSLIIECGTNFSICAKIFAYF